MGLHFALCCFNGVMCDWFRITFQVDSRAAFWEWIKEEFLPGVYKTSWYNDQTFIGPEGYISTREAFLVGMPKLRQVRVKEG